MGNFSETEEDDSNIPLLIDKQKKCPKCLKYEKLAQNGLCYQCYFESVLKNL